MRLWKLVIVLFIAVCARVTFAALPAHAAPAALAAPAELVVSAAASLADAVAAIKPHFEAAYPGIRLVINTGSSGALQQQIERGAPVDAFIAAAEGPVEQLVQKGFIEPGDVRYIAGNRLVLIRPEDPARPAGGQAAAGGATSARSATSAGSPALGNSALALVNDWQDLATARVRRVAIGNPEHVPAGIYGKQVLESLGLWESVRRKLVMGEDVRQVLQYVRIGAVDAGIVYATEAASAPDVAVVAEAPPGSHTPVVYPAAPIRSSRRLSEARAFVDFFLSDTAQRILAEYGFLPAERGGEAPQGERAQPGERTPQAGQAE